MLERHKEIDYVNLSWIPIAVHICCSSPQDVGEFYLW